MSLGLKTEFFPPKSSKKQLSPKISNRTYSGGWGTSPFWCTYGRRSVFFVHLGAHECVFSCI